MINEIKKLIDEDKDNNVKFLILSISTDEGLLTKFNGDSIEVLKGMLELVSNYFLSENHLTAEQKLLFCEDFFALVKKRLTNEM